MLIKFYEKGTRQSDIDRVVRILEGGGLAVLPTDGYYALCCSALKTKAVENVCRLKGINPQKNRLSLICYNLSTISGYTRLDDARFRVLKRHLPGPFTFILPGANKLPKIFWGRKEVGIRMPKNKIAVDLAQSLGAPLLAASLPVDEGKDEAYFINPELIEETLRREVDVVVDGGEGRNVVTTIVDMTGDEWQIVRQGEGIFND